MDMLSENSRFLRSRRWLQFAASAAPVAWGAHGLTSLIVVAKSCQGGHGRAAGIFVQALTVVLLLGVAALGVASYASWRQLAGPGSVVRSEARDQDEMLALVGVFASVAFSIGILWDGLPAFLVTDLCEALR
jgi:hypothetical protein